MRGFVALGLVVASTALGAQDTRPPTEASTASAAQTTRESEVRRRLEAIRQDLVELRFEKALAAIEALLGDPAMTEAERLEALVLRAQTRAAFGDFDGVEDDYGLILGARPAYVPDASLTPARAMERFRKVRDQMVGVARVTLEPPSARLEVDGRPVVPSPDGALPLLGGPRVLRASAPGFDPQEIRLDIEAGKETPVRFRLLPNARTVVVRTEPDGVTVRLDGVPMGETRRPDVARTPGVGPPPAELVLENVALGEHVFELSKACFATRAIRDLLTVDLLDTSPRVFDTIVLQDARARLAVLGEPPGAEVRIDGRSVGALPVDAVELCPGAPVVEVRAGDRLVWRSRPSLARDERVVLEVRPRPNAALVGADDWPAGLAELGSAFSTRGGIAAPGGADLSKPEEWARVALPPDTDLALAVLPPLREGGRDRWLLFSPGLRTVESLDAPPSSPGRPSWTRPAWGLGLADSRTGGTARVVVVREGGAAAAAGVRLGERVVAVGGTAVAAAAAALAELGQRPPGVDVVLSLESSTGERRDVKLRAARSPALWRPHERKAPAQVLAGWAAVDAAAFADEAPSALANLALLQSETGQASLAAETWRRVRWADRAGVGEGTAAYFLGRELLRLGREAEAIEAFRRAAATAARAFGDEGPPVAPAARDHLTDLGVTVEESRTGDVTAR